MEQGTLVSTDGSPLAPQLSLSDVVISQIKELDKNKIYHVAIDNKFTHPAGLRMFAEAAKVLDLKLLITLGETKIETFASTLEKLSPEQKNLVLASLGYNEVNPVNHEQAK